ncbi:DeoR/GlpR transcriptional regulator, partial [Enterococcus faecalis]
IARVACSYLSDYDTGFINSRSTALNILQYLKADHLTIVTNNLKIATKPHVSQYIYFLTGGEFRFPKEVLVGDNPINTIT